MTPRPANDCAHERRPGTTVCLYCRAEERAVIRGRRQRQLMSLGAYGGVAALVVAAMMGAFSAFRGSSADGDTAVATAEARATSDFAAEQAGRARPVAASASRATAPIVPAGRTALSAGIYVERAGDTVVVHFDTRDGRTRRSDKFENVVRETLPIVLGEPARLALARVDPGTLVAPGQLISAVGREPLVLPVGDGRVVSLAPGSRMGQDGPLVVTYRAVIDVSTLAPTS